MPISEIDSKLQIASNVRAHDKIAKKYENRHGEIYNSIEQERLTGVLAKAVALITSTSPTRVALDFGCGAGNLTRKMSDLGCNVIACDVSQGFLDLVASRQYPNSVDVVKLNGVDLSTIPDESVDMVACYSVLHHVPDYMGILGEFVRVLKPGGVIFIDHEASAEVWNPTCERAAFIREMQAAIGCRLCKYLKPRNYIEWFVRKFVNPRYQVEGDIHVYADDHVEWQEIVSSLMKSGVEILIEDDYLLYKRGYDDVVYKRHYDKTSDTRLFIARKIRASSSPENRNDRHGS